MEQEDDCVFHKSAQRTGTTHLPVGSLQVNAISLEDNQAGPSSVSGYDIFKETGFLSVYQSSTTPIQVGGLKLTLEKGMSDGKESSLVESKPVWWCENPGTPPLDTYDGSPVSGSINRVKTSSMVRRIKQIRNRDRRRRGRELKCLRLILSVFYYMGVSPYRPRMAWYPPKIFTRFLKAGHWIFISIAMFQCILQLKGRWIGFRVEPKILTIAEIGIAIIMLIARINTVRVFAVMKKQMDSLMQVCPEEESVSEEESTTSGKLKMMIGVLVAVSIFMALASVLFGYFPLRIWSFEKQQRYVAYDTNEYIAIWSPNNWKNVTEEIIDQYTDEMSLQIVVFAVVGDTVAFFGNLYDNLMVDFWFALSYQVHYIQHDLRQMIDNNAGIPNVVEFDDVWAAYIESRVACDQLDIIFGPLLKWIHVSNIFRMSEFLLDIMQNDFSAMRLNSFINLLKVFGAYFWCQLSAEMNGKMQENVMSQADTSGFVEINETKVNVLALRKEMKLHQIGLGRGNFLVEETFILKMVCAAWSVFALFADHSPNRAE